MIKNKHISIFVLALLLICIAIPNISAVNTKKIIYKEDGFTEITVERSPIYKKAKFNYYFAKHSESEYNLLGTKLYTVTARGLFIFTPFFSQVIPMGYYSIHAGGVNKMRYSSKGDVDFNAGSPVTTITSGYFSYLNQWGSGYTISITGYPDGNVLVDVDDR